MGALKPTGNGIVDIGKDVAAAMEYDEDNIPSGK